MIVYCRGSHWHAIYTFDIRKVPTEVRVRFAGDQFDSCMCSMVCGSWLQVNTPGDQKRLAEQMDLLQACLEGALMKRALRSERDFEPSREREIRSEHSREGDGRLR
jgi:hypothetical protein